MLNIHDPVAMHLLMETAISDSKNFEILSFDEVEQLKKERVFLRNKVEATRRKLALETKLRDAAQSLNRLYSTHGRKPSNEIKVDAGGQGSKSKRGSFFNRKGSLDEVSSKADDEYAASTRKVEEFKEELTGLETRLTGCNQRIMEHTAGILQMTHRGLKKNIRRNQLPQSPESMSSQNRSGSRLDGMDDFDERSYYGIPDYVQDFNHPAITNGKQSKAETQTVKNVFDRLNELSQRLHGMIQQMGSQEHFDPPPAPSTNRAAGGLDALVQAQIGYVSQGLDAIESAQARTTADTQRQIFDSEDQLEDVNVKLHDMLARTNSVSRNSPVLPQDEPRGKDLQSQLAFSTEALERLNARISSLVEQKDILTRQIQQQRELNNKSDAQRDAQIGELTEQLEATRKLHNVGEQESQQLRGQIDLLMEQLDKTKQDGAHHEELKTAKASSDAELRKAREDLQQMESEVVRTQTELAMVKAELDGAYGSRAQRAADVSANPAVQAEIDNLKKELKDTIEDYEVMTKQSIEAEKDRDRYEDKIDALEQKCETLESQLNEERVKWMGVKQSAPNETTSTMVLKTEFKKMMRETRAEQTKAFKVIPLREF